MTPALGVEEPDMGLSDVASRLDSGLQPAIRVAVNIETRSIGMSFMFVGSCGRGA